MSPKSRRFTTEFVHTQGMQDGLDKLAARWLPGGHLQTLWPALLGRLTYWRQPVPFARERWSTPDADFIDVDWLRQARPARALLVLFHGLEGSSRSHYAQAFARYAQRAGLDFAVPHFRGCSGEPNWQARAYHSGDHREVGWILQRLRARSHRPVLAVGVSMGGNALLRWAQEVGPIGAQQVAALAAISAPVDLQASGQALDRGLNQQLYGRLFLATMKVKAQRQLQRFPGLFDAQALRRVRTLDAFDNLVTAPLHGFANTRDYWRRASAKPGLARITLPTLLLNARNDPFVPAHSLPTAHEVGAHVALCQPRRGGHVGFLQGSVPGHQDGLTQAVGDWLQQKGGLYG